MATRPIHSKPAQISSKALALILALALSCPSLPSQENSGNTGYVFRAETDLVLVNVTVRDKSGNLVRDLKQEDFSLTEDGKAQKVASFDIENTDAVPPANVEQANLLNTPQSALKTRSSATPATQAPTPANLAAALKDHRLIILFFDLSSMQPDDIDRAALAAENYVQKQMQPADLVSVVSLGSSLVVNQDFTSDHDLLLKMVRAFN